MTGGSWLTGRSQEPRRRAELKRTCNRCEHEWYLSHKQGKERVAGRGQMGLASFGSYIGKAKQRTAMATRLTAMELKKQRVQAMTACPGCGSQSYAEEEVAI